MQHSRTAGYLTLATGLHFVSVGTNRVPPAPSTAKWTCKHVRLARCSREGQKKDLEKAEHFPALNLPSLVISDNTRCFHHCVDTIAALLLTTPCGIFSDVPFYSIIPAPICQCFFKGRKRGQTRADGEIQRSSAHSGVRTESDACSPSDDASASFHLRSSGHPPSDTHRSLSARSRKHWISEPPRPPAPVPFSCFLGCAGNVSGAEV